jgi:hypothetical protein
MVAGAGRKVFGSETLSSVEVQSYLMDQVVPQFDSATARDVAIPAPADGVICYLRDLDVFTERVNGGWYVRSSNGGTQGVMTGPAPAQGVPLRLKTFYGNVVTNGSGVGSVTLPTGPGAFTSIAAVLPHVTVPSPINWNPTAWTVTTITLTAYLLTTGATANGLSIGTSLTVIGV